ncbi:MAG: helix-turn-helix domain-containing protein [Actinobacteria bacterium]|nr:helix-turn-helix domain-containing protein [Actinomycetota bacterium]
MRSREQPREALKRSAQPQEQVTREVADLTGKLRLAELRTVRGRTQAQLAQAIGTSQSGVSRLERQQDLLVSTLRDYVAATGGTLRLVASYPGFETQIDLPALETRTSRALMPREFRVIWQNQQTRRFVHVGWLQFSGTRFTFTYTAEAHLDADFEPFPVFPDLHGAYESVDLFAFFAERFATSAVGEAKLAAALGLNGDEATPVELLARSWGKTPHDGIQVVPEPLELADGSTVRLFLASGARHVNEEDPDSVAERIAQLQRGEPLTFRDEPDNPINPQAIILETSSPRHAVGWIPDYLLDEVHKRRDAGDDLRVYVEHANREDVAWHLRLLCRLELRQGRP